MSLLLPPRFLLFVFCGELRGTPEESQWRSEREGELEMTDDSGGAERNCGEDVTVGDEMRWHSAPVIHQTPAASTSSPFSLPWPLLSRLGSSLPSMIVFTSAVVLCVCKRVRFIYIQKRQSSISPSRWSNTIQYVSVWKWFLTSAASPALAPVEETVGVATSNTSTNTLLFQIDSVLETFSINFFPSLFFFFFKMWFEGKVGLLFWW